MEDRRTHETPAVIEARKRARTDHPIHPILAGRWSPRAFAERSVESAALRSLFEAARWAPSSRNEQPWAFAVARKEEERAFARALACLVPGNREWARAAPVLALAFAKTAFDHGGEPNRTHLHDLGLAAAHFTFQAEAMGLHVHQMAGIDREAVRETYGVPDGWEPVTGIAIGYLGEPKALSEKRRRSETAPRTRKPLAEFVFSEAWGEPAGWLGRDGVSAETPSAARAPEATEISSRTSHQIE